MKISFRRLLAILPLMGGVAALAQCDPLEVDFGGEPWGLAPDGVETFFEPAELGVSYTDDVHLLVPSYASEVVPDTPLDAPIDSVVISAVLLVDTLSGDTIMFSDAGLDYACNNLGDCADPCTFLGGGQYCAAFTGVPTVAGSFMLTLEVEVWATVFGFPLATPFSFSGFPFPIAGEVDGVEAHAAHRPTVFPNPAQGWMMLQGAQGMDATLWSLDGQRITAWNVSSMEERVQLEDVPAGLYALELVSSGRREVLRVSVSH